MLAYSLSLSAMLPFSSHSGLSGRTVLLFGGVGGEEDWIS